MQLSNYGNMKSSRYRIGEGEFFLDLNSKGAADQTFVFILTRFNRSFLYGIFNFAAKIPLDNKNLKTQISL